jgi:hypothetical protein
VFDVCKARVKDREKKNLNMPDDREKGREREKSHSRKDEVRKPQK